MILCYHLVMLEENRCSWCAVRASGAGVVLCVDGNLHVRVHYVDDIYRVS